MEVALWTMPFVIHHCYQEYYNAAMYGEILQSISSLIEALSDHCPIIIALQLQPRDNVGQENEKVQEIEALPPKIIWNPNSAEVFKAYLESSCKKQTIEVFEKSDIYEGKVEDHVIKFTNFITEVASKAGKLCKNRRHYVYPCQRFSTGNTLEDYNP
jgi:hypothetical protein